MNVLDQDLSKIEIKMLEQAITRFKGKHQFLSNFYPCRVRFGVEFYASVEHAYQAAKTTDIEERKRIRRAATPGEAKRLGRRVKHLREDWETVKYAVMLECLRSKFGGIHKTLHDMLLATGDVELVEENDWGDCEWGVCNGEGRNLLGKALMHVRAELRNAVRRTANS